MENGGYIVAIDLGSNTVSVVAGLRADQGKVRVVDAEIVPVEGMVRGEIKNIEQVVKGIQKAVGEIEKRQQIKITDVFMGVSGQHIRFVKYPYYVFVGKDGEIREEDVRKLHESMSNVQAPDGENIIQIIPESYSVDQEETVNPVGTFGNKLEALFNFVLGDSNSVSRIKRLLNRLHINQSGLFLNALASAEAVTTPDEREEGVAVIDMGGGLTEVTVFYRSSVRHIVIIPIGGNVINKDIRSYGILERNVENIKVKCGNALRANAPADHFISTKGVNARTPKEISFQNLAAIIEARMLDIIDFAMEQIKTAGFANKLGAGVVLTGGAAATQDLDQLFKNYTGLDVRVAVPDLLLEEGSIDAVLSPAYSTAVGLLIKGAASTPPPTVRPARHPMPPYGGFSEPEDEDSFGRQEPPKSKRGLFRGGKRQFEDDGQQPPVGPQEGGGLAPLNKGGFMSRLKKGFEKVFDMDVIEDNEI